MSFLGYDFLSDSGAITPTTTRVDEEKTVVLEGGTFYELYVTRDLNMYNVVDSDTASFPSAWTDDTLIHAYFDGSLMGGNLDYSVDQIQEIRLKRREVGAQDWTTVYSREVTCEEDMTFSYIDSYAKGRSTVYEYAVVPVINGAEMNLETRTVESKFDGALISDSETRYHILLEPRVTTTTKNRQSSVVTTLNNKYPFVIYGGEAKYETGSFSGIALVMDGADNIDHLASIEYRRELSEWLTNGLPKILKMYDGREWMIAVNGGVTQDCGEHYDKVYVSFEFVEIGDARSTEDLADNNFITVEGS